jgi:hypothetical protein
MSRTEALANKLGWNLAATDAKWFHEIIGTELEVTREAERQGCYRAVQQVLESFQTCGDNKAAQICRTCLGAIARRAPRVG